MFTIILIRPKAIEFSTPSQKMRTSSVTTLTDINIYWLKKQWCECEMHKHLWELGT